MSAEDIEHTWHFCGLGAIHPGKACVCGCGAVKDPKTGEWKGGTLASRKDAETPEEWDLFVAMEDEREARITRRGR